MDAGLASAEGQGVARVAAGSCSEGYVVADVRREPERSRPREEERAR